MDGRQLLEDLTDAQRRAVSSPSAPLCVLAGAGSGKTRVLTRRIAYRALTGAAEPSHVLALTFTRRAAGELRARLARLGLGQPVAAGTFHAAAFAQLRRYWCDRGLRPPTLLERKAALLAPLVGPSPLGATSRGTTPVRPAAGAVVAAVAAEVEWAKARLVSPADYHSAAAAAGRCPAVPLADVANLYADYEAAKRRRGVIDLDDLLQGAAEVMEADTDFAKAQRWRWQHLFVDEYQDLNPAHGRLLAAWLGPSLDLCAVGDPDQAIYGWNGSDPSLLARFAERYPTAEIVELGDNFRSSPEILAVAETVLADRAARPATSPPGPVPTVTAYLSDAHEAAGLARAVRDRHLPGTAWSRMAVLTRTNAQLAVIAGALGNAGIPYRVKGGRPLDEVPVVRELLEGPVGRSASSLAGDLRLRLADGGDPATTAAVRDGLAALREYLDLDPGGDVAAFAAWLQAADRRSEGPAEDAVVLSTFHRAKGLEWPVVFVAGLEDGLVPLARNGGALTLAEERRLLYVALTRAEAELHCSWARQRTFGGRLVPRRPSPHLAAIETAITGLETTRRPFDPRPHLEALRQQLHADRRPSRDLAG